MINIIGLGPGAKDALTLAALEALKQSNCVYLRTHRHPTVDYLRELNIDFKSFDDIYDSSENFDEVYNTIAMDIINYHEKQGDLIYAVPGHPRVAEKSVDILISLCEEKGIEYNILPAVSFIDTMMERLKLDPIEGIKIIDAFDIKNQVLEKRVGTIITQVYNRFIASEVKLALLEFYRDDTEVVFVRAAGVKGEESIRKIPIYEIDRQEDIDHLTSIYIPKSIEDNKDFYDLLYIMETLRGENGCPWDREQTHETLKKYLIEESYEVIEAIDKNDDEELVEELGDLLLQVVFHSQIGKEDGYFNINDVISSISNKMIRRHPHVFGEIQVKDSEEVLGNWQEIKKQEKGYTTYTEQLKHISKTFPALIRAGKIGEKASAVGFDWENVEDVFSKVLEELNEVKNVYKSNNKAKILEEIGDLIFSCVNISRFLDIDPEFALNYTIDKFIMRFQFIEEKAAEKGLKVQEMTLEQMNDLWEAAKLK